MQSIYLGYLSDSKNENIYSTQKGSIRRNQVCFLKTNITGLQNKVVVAYSLSLFLFPLSSLTHHSEDVIPGKVI